MVVVLNDVWPFHPQGRDLRTATWKPGSTPGGTAECVTNNY